MSRADVIVVGLGAVGSAATLHLAKQGQRVRGFDTWSPPHSNGSSHGETRITRLAIGEGEEYSPLAIRSHELWREFEREAGVDLLVQCGGLIISNRVEAKRKPRRAGLPRQHHRGRAQVQHQARVPVGAGYPQALPAIQRRRPRGCLLRAVGRLSARRGLHRGATEAGAEAWRRAQHQLADQACSGPFPAAWKWSARRAMPIRPSSFSYVRVRGCRAC